jgi:predicted metalloprotease
MHHQVLSIVPDPYMDLAFFEELKTRLELSGDFATAYSNMK